METFHASITSAMALSIGFGMNTSTRAYPTRHSLTRVARRGQFFLRSSVYPNNRYSGAPEVVNHDTADHESPHVLRLAG